MLIKVGQKFETWMRKVLPDPLVIAIILTLIVGLLAVIFTPTTPIQVVENWSKGFWELIAFTMQVAFGLIAGAVLAKSPIVNRGMVKLCSLPKKNSSAVLLLSFTTLVLWWVNWGIGLIAGALFGGSSWVATSAYFIGFAAIIISGIILKKTKLFAGDPAPFVMELPAYHVPAWGNVLRATWERGWSFIKRAGTVILAATIILWFLQGFGFENGAFTMVEDQDNSILAIVASTISCIFIPQGFGNWRATVASISGLIAKENVVGTFGVLYHYADELSENGDEIWPEVAASFTAISAYSFMIFNLLCAPCFAAMGAIKREMNNGKWTAIAIGYMCLFAYCASLVVYQIGGLITGEVGFNFFTIVAVAIIAVTIYLLFRPNKYEGVNEVQFDSKKAVASK